MDYLQKLFEWFANFWESLVNFVQDVFYWIVNTIIDIIGTGISWAVSLLPTYTVQVPSFSNDGIINALNWIFPVNYCISLMAAISMGLVLYLTVGTVLRWFKVVR